MHDFHINSPFKLCKPLCAFVPELFPTFVTEILISIQKTLT